MTIQTWLLYIFANKVFIGCLILVLLLAYNYVFLAKSGEFLNPKQIYARQKLADNLIIYSSGIFEGVTEPKFYAYAQIKPRIIAFGSSRVLQFRQAAFSTKFYNLGYTFTNIAEALAIVPRILATHVPETVIIGIDYWWFNTEYATDNYDLAVTPEKSAIHLGHILKPFHWLKTKKITVKEYAGIFFNKSNPHIGVKAKYNLAGIGPDGSYYYGDIITGLAREYGDKHFMDKKKRVIESNRKFEHGTHISQRHFNKFLEMIRMFRDRGVRVVLFLPPYAPDLYEYMQGFNYAYFDDLRAHLQAANLRVYDYTNPLNSIADTSNCEFIDGMHGGEILHARILRDLAQHELELAEYININYVQEITKKYSGFAMVPNTGISKLPEVDFLGCACQKTNS